MYGYQITKLIKEQSDNQIQIREGSLYPLLHKMEAKGIIESSIRRVGNRSRKYYHITESGRTEAVTIFEEMSKYMSVMNRMFNPKLT
jgi:DNA-binding PadR family transcriptional regulator